ncbi:hypothetical protein GYMLUDRAFT_202102, partial [Collybiopsis luxurians FD-317 M1]
MAEQRCHFIQELLETIPNLQPPPPQDSQQLACNADSQTKQNGKEREVLPSEALQGYLFAFDYSDGLQSGRRTVILGRLLFQPTDINGRGPIVVEVHCDCQGHSCDWKGSNGRCNWDGLDLIVKIRFPAAGRVYEEEIIRHLLNLAAGPHTWVCNHLPNLLCSFTIPFDGHGVQGKLQNKLDDEEIHKGRVIRGSIQERIFPIWEVECEFEEAQVVYDAFQCHEWVHDIGRVLHRDISMNNVMFRRIEGKIYGVLNDFDLATCIDDLDRTPTSKHRTGTRPFMAYEQHYINWNGPPRYRHDAESFFYLILILGCDYSRPGKKVKDPPFQAWINGGDEYLFDKKSILCTNGKFSPPTATARFRYRIWLRKIQLMLFHGVTS